jgi:hypothetical protein
MEDWQGMLLVLSCSIGIPGLAYLFFYILPRFLDKWKEHRGKLSKEQLILLNQAKLSKYNDYKILLSEYTSLVNQSYLNTYNYAKSGNLSDYAVLKEVRKCDFELSSMIRQKKYELDTIMENGTRLYAAWLGLYMSHFDLEDTITTSFLRQRLPFKVNTEHVLVLLDKANKEFESQKNALSARLMNDIKKTENELLSIA